MEAKRTLPIGIQTFRRIREDGCYYVDKTGHALRLAGDAKHLFLSRPRRFGKSLFLDMLKELFEGSEELFAGLEAHGRWDWSVRHPVVRLDFSGASFSAPGDLEDDLAAQLDALERQTGIVARYERPAIRFRHLVRALCEKTGQRVVVLVDEYDKPVLDALDNPELARANREILRGLYSTIKFNDAQIKLTFLAGVSKFSKVSLFSGLNNLLDISLDPRYSTICGYTQQDLETVFAPELAGLDAAAIREWYNGYSWSGTDKVYNPFDVLLLFKRRTFDAHWFETGTPSFLVKTLLEQGVGAANLEGLRGTNALLSSFDVDDIALEALLFQTGYLTIADVEDRDGQPFFRLGYPNREVRQSLNDSLLKAMLPAAAHRLVSAAPLRGLLEAEDFAGLEALLRTLLSGIPYNWHVNNNMAHFEGYYASVFYASFAAAGLDVRAEDATSHGRLDMAVLLGERVFLFEFKVSEAAPQGSALAQLKARGYADKYRRGGKRIHLVGVEFSREQRNLTAFDVERA
ncbi:MAG: ATP-binding protein [Gammaproteobacteria bacterium]|nr:ATP-binding protein [Gammaproteobacteria bacterium]